MKKYVVYAYNKNFSLAKTFETDSPSTAINKWLFYIKKYPDTVIACGNVKNILVLYKEFCDNVLEYEKKWEPSNLPYNFGYVRDRAIDGLRSGRVPRFNPQCNPSMGYYDLIPGFGV